MEENNQGANTQQENKGQRMSGAREGKRPGASRGMSEGE